MNQTKYIALCIIGFFCSDKVLVLWVHTKIKYLDFTEIFFLYSFPFYIITYLFSYSTSFSKVLHCLHIYAYTIPLLLPKRIESDSWESKLTRLLLHLHVVCHCVALTFTPRKNNAIESTILFLL